MNENIPSLADFPLITPFRRDRAWRAQRPPCSPVHGQI